MLTEIQGFPFRIKYITKSEKFSIRSVEVMVSVHPLQLPRKEITSLHCLCNGKDCWIEVGHVSTVIDGFDFLAYHQFFDYGVPYVGTRGKLREAIEAVVMAVLPVLVPLEKEPAV